MLNIK